MKLQQIKDEIAAKILNLVPKNIELEKKGTLEDCPLTPDTFLNTTATVGEMGSVGLGGLSTFYLFRILYGTIRAKKQIGLLDEIFNTINVGLLISAIFASDVGFGICSRVKKATEIAEPEDGQSFLEKIKSKFL